MRPLPRRPAPRLPDALRRTVSRCADVLRRPAPRWVQVLRRLLWPPEGRSRNRAYLRDRLIALPLLTVVAFTTLGWAYADVRADSTYIRTELAPALGDLADARISLLIAQREAEVSLDAGDAVELSGLGPRYAARTGAAAQDIARLSRGGAFGEAQRQELDVVSGLIDGYEEWIAWARTNVGNDALRKAGLAYAQSMLCSEETAEPTTDRSAPYPPCGAARGVDATTVVDRIAALERELRHRLDDRSALGARVLAAAAVSLVSFTLLAVGVWRTLVFLHRRMRIRVSVPLLAAALPLLLVPWAVADGVRSWSAQRDAVPYADVLADRASPAVEVHLDEDPLAPPDPAAIRPATARMEHTVGQGRFGDVGAAAAWVMPVGLLSAGVMAGALHAYRREYLVVGRGGGTS
ncbi:hypothetical protein OKJ48_43440 [Streptomyces kunmingensis]|uniref:Integral membrane protein n=1 Tax=Streptomyces kunmingensis TaxID=68225 RepID=A0ABU6CQM4_9ACTN|nr:hypothetical protein [Streptomyces kunmingensis]MEB3967044.1 hypothetical protein [Streptomyces kunmingensis]